MNTGLKQTNKKGFSLVELLLTLVLMLCLAAATVFSFTALHRTANLEEGYGRFQSLIRFAQAEAATSGKKVRIEFENPTSAVEQTGSELRRIKVTWEADALNAPGVFLELTNKAWSEEVVNELVGVERVQSLQSPNAPAPAPASFAAPPQTLESEKELIELDFPAITFYPDGSCDAAEIVLVSRNQEDTRRLAVRLSGLMGAVTSREINQDNREGSEVVDELTASPEAFRQPYQTPALQLAADQQGF